MPRPAPLRPTRRAVLKLGAGALTLGAPSFAAGPAAAAEDPVYADRRGGAINGYDPVAYFTEGRAVEGDPQITHAWNGAVWRFASTGNRDLFAADPARWAPQYGGYCSWAVSKGYTARTDPDAWTVRDGKLYLNYSKSVRNTWRNDLPDAIHRADANYPRLVK